MNDPTESLVTRSLADHAADAPADTTLLGDVHRRLRRRRFARTAGAVVVACAAVATAITGVHGLTESSPPESNVVATRPGWHWESYANVQLQVPDSWKGQDYSHLWNCPESKTDGPIVGRPTLGPVVAMACVPRAGAVPAAEVGVPPVADRVSHVFFDSDARPGAYARGSGWVEETRVIGGTAVSVFTDDDALRRTILDSARVITGTDVNGCQPTSRFASDRAARPSTGRGLDAVGDVRSIAVCAYLASPLQGRPPLLASATLTGATAYEVGAALKATTTGRPPVLTTGQACQIVGQEEILVLVVTGTAAEEQVVVRYQGCSGDDGFDDGTDLRPLTKPGLKPLLEAVDRPSVSPAHLADLLR
ncbi:hypothetical protein FB561_2723 [Kribbella amoyensis]|uniref:Uncharacterized protein n=1 Tax=Kribbella amoyensis TaxID=996641 RepID=A0A561BRT3_9ACTN|nr:hypothetical protein [Kribbella amoyensis]TWD81607.1 hypothetical protein FB561_2723 [Kribbella amoyensis]